MELRKDKNRKLADALLNDKDQEALKLLNAKDIDPNAMSPYNSSPVFFYAVSAGNTALAEAFIARGTDVNKPGHEGRTALMQAVTGVLPAMFDLLLEQGANIDQRDGDGWTALMHAIQHDQTAMADRLLEKEADVSVVSTKYKYVAGICPGSTALHIACEKNDQTMAEKLILRGADVNVSDGYGSTPLHRAVVDGKMDLLKLLLEHDADINAVTESGGTLLQAACYSGQEEMVKFLLRKSVDVNVANNSGYTALHHAAEKGYGNLVKLLVDAGADPSLMDNQGNTPEILARKTEHEGLAQFLASLVKPAREGWTMTGPKEVICVTENAGSDYRLTDIFNFESRIFTRLARNLETGGESQTMRCFDEFTDKTIINVAREELEKLGGKVDEAVVTGSVILKPQMPRAGG